MQRQKIKVKGTATDLVARLQYLRGSGGKICGGPKGKKRFRSKTQKLGTALPGGKKKGHETGGEKDR